MKKFIVITTINKPTKAIIKFSEFNEWQLVLVGDKKTPSNQRKIKNTKYLNVKWQKDSKFNFVDHCPYNHYSRKNIGYLYAINNGADQILDTDDDNIPYKNWERFFEIDRNAEEITNLDFVNIYKFFTERKIWPRGFPLSRINEYSKPKLKKLKKKCDGISIIQGLANNDPDVDAIFRLTDGKRVIFNKRVPIILDKGVYCPFNSQNTLWHKEAFAYLYLPVSVSFRFTDILRGYVAQRGIWELNNKLAFTGASVYQKRNIHNYMKDFEDEIECYMNVENVVNILQSITLSGNPFENIKTIYLAFLQEKIVKEFEIESLQAWISDIKL